MDIVVLGGPDFIVGFRLAGIRKVLETTSDDFEKKVQEMLDSHDVGIMVVNMKDVDGLPAAVRKRMIDSTTPVVIPVGTEPGDMRDKVRRAIGVDLYKGE
jgi:V/A-type H+/Na+-transporting ATPase subunit F